MEVIYRCKALLRSWSLLQRLENHDPFTEVSTRLEETAKKFITHYRWLHNRMIFPPMTFSAALVTFWCGLYRWTAVCILTMQRPGVILKPFK
jgi:hypothetical protein